MKSFEKQYGKKVISFGKWVVTTKCVVWNAIPYYWFDGNSLWETRNYMGKKLWDWLLQLPPKTWLKARDVYHLNTAFFFALDYFKDLKPEGVKDISTAETLRIQKKFIDAKTKN